MTQAQFTNQSVIEHILQKLPEREQHVHERVYFGTQPRAAVFPFIRVAFIDNPIIESFTTTEERMRLQVDIFADFNQGNALLSTIERDVFRWLHGKFHQFDAKRFFTRCRTRDVRSTEDKVLRSRSDYELRVFTSHEEVSE